jgi:hypothetical protein
VTPAPILYERVDHGDGTSTLRFYAHGSGAEDPSEELLEALRWLAIPEVFAVSGAVDVLAH